MYPDVQLNAVFFDMDGVLVDVSRSYRRVIEETAMHFAGRRVLPGTAQRYKDAGGFNDDWKLTQAIISDLGVQVPLARVVEAFQRRYRGEAWDGFIQEETALIQTDTLAALAGEGRRILGLVTGRPGEEARWTLQRFGWESYFPLVVAMEDQEGRGKPDPYPLQRALTMLDAAGRRIPPEQAVYIGDTGDDMRAARAAGMWAVGFVPPYDEIDPAVHTALLYERGAHLVCNCLDVLPALFDAFGAHISAAQMGGTAWSQASAD